MDARKSEKISVSLQGDVLAALDKHVLDTRDNRSSYIQDLIVRDLTAAGKLGIAADEFGQVIAAAKEIGFAQALNVLRSAARTPERATLEDGTRSR